jgi:hypothetical protein
MKKYLVLCAILLSLVAIPVFAQSTITAEQIIQALIANPALLAQLRSLLLGCNNITPTCGGYSFGQDLYVGKSGNDVANLQDALVREGFDDGIGHDEDEEVADRFGENTAANVVQFQKKYGIKQTGYVGPLTRSKLNALYKSKCVQPINVQAPVITGVSGPGNLKVGETGTWGVRAYDPQGGALGYSVLWGDEGTTFGRPASEAGLLNSNSQQATFTHHYNQPGLYKVGFTVTNNQNQSAQSSLSVRVSESNQAGISVTIDSNPTLALQYDSSQGEAALVANFLVTISNNSSNSSDAMIFKNGGIGGIASSILASGNKAVVGSASNVVTPQSSLDSFTDPMGNQYWVIPVGSSASFKVSSTFNPKTMFAGNYTASVQYVTIRDEAGNYNSVQAASNQTNSVVVVGEKSPYVTSVQTGSESGVFGVAGERLSQVTQLVVANYQGGMVTVNKSDFSVSTNYAIEVPLSKLNRPAGSYYVYLISPTGNSNNYSFQIGGSTQPSITVISPNGGENLELGKTYRIRWSTNGYPNTANVQLGLYDTRYSTEGGAYPEITIANQPNWGFYDWTVPASLNRDFGGSVTTAYHKIKAYIGSGGTSGFDESDNGFSFRQADLPKITVLSPNGGESYKIGDTATIRWSSSLLDGKVAIYLVRSGKEGCSVGIVPASAGSYSFQLSSNSGHSCTVSEGQYQMSINKWSDVTGNDFNVEDMSDSFFTISTVTPSTYTISITPSTGGTANVSPSQSTYAAGQRVLFTPTANSGYQFVNWTGDLSGSLRLYPVTVSKNMTVGATFEPVTPPTSNYTVTVSPTTGGGITVSPNQSTYAAGQRILFTPTADSGYQFVNWTGDLSGSLRLYPVNISKNMTVGAVFQPVTPPTTSYTIFTNPGYGGLITLSPSKASYAGGEQVRVTVVPNSGYKLASWTGYAANVLPSVTELNLIVTQNMTIGATFAPIVPTVTTYTPSQAMQISYLQYDNCAGNSSSGAFYDSARRPIYICFKQAAVAPGADLISDVRLAMGASVSCPTGFNSSGGYFKDDNGNWVTYCIQRKPVAVGQKVLSNIFFPNGDCLDGLSGGTFTAGGVTRRFCVKTETVTAKTSQAAQSSQMAGLLQGLQGLLKTLGR